MGLLAVKLIRTDHHFFCNLNITHAELFIWEGVVSPELLTAVVVKLLVAGSGVLISGMNDCGVEKLVVTSIGLKIGQINGQIFLILMLMTFVENDC